MKEILLIFVILMTFFSCKDATKLKFLSGPSVSTPAATPQNPLEGPSFEELSNQVLIPYSCVLCHTWAKTEEELATRIKDGNPYDSPLYLWVEDARMPIGGEELSPTDLQLVEDYIRQFAP